MKNLWYIFGITVFSIIALIIIGIVLYVKKSKNLILSEILIMIFLVFLIVENVPYIKDITRQETIEITATYVEYQKGSVDPGAWRLIFEDEDCTYKIISPIITKNHVKMKIGKTYKIEYYKNTKTIKNYTLIK